MVRGLMTMPPKRRRPPMQSEGPRVRRGTLRIPGEIAARVRSGHPYLFREALGGRPLRESAGEVLELVDPEGQFVARGLYDPDGIVVVRVVSRDPSEMI